MGEIRTDEFWNKVFNEYENSDKTHKQLMTEYSIPESTYEYQLRKYRKSKKGFTEFVKLPNIKPATGSTLKLTINNKYQLQISSGFNKSELKEIILILEDCK